MKQVYSRNPIKMPKVASKKVYEIGNGLFIFIRRLKKMTFAYEHSSGVQLMCVASSDWDDQRICQYVQEHISYLEGFMQLQFEINEDGNLELPKG